VDWGLPDGITAGPLRWPVPIQFVQPGDLAAYGYEGTVLLASELELPRDLSADGLEVSASVSWLACKEKCVLGATELREKLPLPIAAESFEAWRASLPRENGPFSVSTIGSIDPASRQGRLSIWLDWDAAPARVEWFPEADERLKVSDVQVRSRGKLTRIDFNATVVGAGGGIEETMKSVVVAGGDGRRRGWQLTVPLAGSS
jgi:thiol:disulfide interchange protein DsbD